MLRRLERIFKRFLSRILRGVFSSSPILVSPESSFHRILVVRQHNQLGDMLCVVPMLRALRVKYPRAFVVLIASPVNYEVMRNNRYVDKVLNFDKKRGWRAIVGFLRALRAERFELAIVASTVSVSFTSDLFAYLSGARVRIGPGSLDGVENPSSFFFNVPVHLDWRSTPHRHQAMRNLDVVKSLGIASDDLRLEMHFDESENQSIHRLRQHKLATGKRTIAYHPGAGKIPNRWDARKFALVATTLAQEFNASTLITSGPMDDDAVSQMIQSLVVPYDLIKGKPIREVAAVLSTVDLLISNDTGIMHVAGTVGIPILSLFGPTDPEQWAPAGEKNRWRRGRNGDINSITVDEVVGCAREMLRT